MCSCNKKLVGLHISLKIVSIDQLLVAPIEKSVTRKIAKQKVENTYRKLVQILYKHGR